MASDEPHRPPKYVDGVYKPHFSDPEADLVLMKASMLPQEHDDGLYWATTDDDGGAKGVVRRFDGTPISEGAGLIVGHLRDGNLEYRAGNHINWSKHIDGKNVPEVPDGGE